MATAFVRQLLGMGNIDALVDRIKDAVPNPENQTEMLARLQQGVFTLRDMYEQFQNIMKMGPLNKVRGVWCVLCVMCGVCVCGVWCVLCGACV